jgi:hypothetical protein
MIKVKFYSAEHRRSCFPRRSAAFGARNLGGVARLRPRELVFDGAAKVFGFGIVALFFISGCSRAPSTEESNSGVDAAVWRTIDAEFASPPAEFRMVQNCGHEGAVPPIEKMRDAGIGGVMLFMSKHNYLRNEQAWTNMLTSIRLAKEAGMQVWVADDNGYPSGQAGGLVVEVDPAFELRVLSPVVRRGQGPQTIRMDLPPTAEKFVSAMIYPEKDGQPVYADGVAVAISGNRLVATGLDGPWVLHAFAVKINNDAGSPAVGTASPETGFGNTGHYPNLLDSAAMEKFVDLTHAEYARRLGSLTKQIDLFYSNEPQLGTTWFTNGERQGGEVFLSWVSELPQRFDEDHGYDLMPLLPALFGGDNDEARLVRRHFHQTVGAMLAENFSGRIGAWAEKHGVGSTGHPLLEESMLFHVASYGDFFKFVEPMQVLACDVPMPDGQSYNANPLHFGASWNYWMPKFLSSVAQAKDRKDVVALLDPIVARTVHDLVLPAQKIRRIVNLAAFCGVNRFTNYLFWDQYDPADYRALNEYIGRLCLVLQGARSAATVAVYYPIETLQAEFLPAAAVWSPEFWPKVWQRIVERIKDQDEVARSLVLRGIDFNWLHGDWIREGHVEDGVLIAANGRYTTIVMPEVELLPLDVAEKLARFEKGGGKIIWVKSLPQLGDTPAEHEKVRGLFSGQKTVQPTDVTTAIGPVLPPGFDLRTGGTPLTARFVRDGRRINFLVNYRDKPMDVPLESASNAPLAVQVYNPADGSITARQTPTTVTIAPQSSLLVVDAAAKP